MSRGSKPGERRGGRQRRTPNKRTVVRDRILAAASANPITTLRELVQILVGDQALPGDVRIAIAHKMPEEAASKKTNTRANGMDLLLKIVADQAATEAGRLKAATQIAEFCLPKVRGQKRKRFPADEFGFSVDPQLAKEFRDIRWKIAGMHFKSGKLAPDAFAKKVSKFYARLDGIRRVLQPPDPSRYSEKAMELDRDRLTFLSKRRVSNEIFSPEEDLEEARLMVRLESCLAWPEKANRALLEELREKKSASDKGYGVPLTPAEATTCRYLSVLYPLDPPQILFSRLLESHPEFLDSHPFNTDSLPQLGVDEAVSSPPENLNDQLPSDGE